MGRATALLFAQNGYNVVIAARNPDKLRATEAELVSSATRGSVCSATSTDITDETAVARLVEDVTSKYENVSILINCAGAPKLPWQDVVVLRSVSAIDFVICVVRC